tara:strand:+ start:36 stop:335 length:300 start_codon:yes stop_codon:yes gene_type:complete
MNLNDITNRVKELSKSSSGKIESKIKFKFNDGCIFIDDTINTTIINNEDNEAHCTIIIDNSDFVKLLNKETDSMQLFISGKMKIEGDMTVAMKLSSIFG